jgi:hypothetical protein
LAIPWSADVHGHAILRLRIFKIRLALFLEAVEPLQKRIERFLNRRAIVDITVHSATGIGLDAFLNGCETLDAASAIDLCIDAFNLAYGNGIIGKVGWFRGSDFLYSVVVEDRLKMLKVIATQRAFGSLNLGLARRSIPRVSLVLICRRPAPRGTKENWDS